MSLARFKVTHGWWWVPILSVVLLSGCESDSNNAFIESPVASFFGTGAVVNPGESTALAVRLDRRAPKDVVVSLLTVQYPAGSFQVPSTVTIRSGASAALFEVRALNPPAQSDDRAEITIVPGPAYRVGAQPTETVRVVTAALPSVGLVGPDVSLSSGGNTFYSVQRTRSQDAVTVRLVVSGDVDCFSVPESVALGTGVATRSFEVRALCEGPKGILIELLPPTGYVLGDRPSVRVNITQSQSSAG